MVPSESDMSSSDSAVIPKWWVSSLSFMFSEKTAGETFFLESSLAFRLLRLDTSLSRPDPETQSTNHMEEHTNINHYH